MEFQNCTLWQVEMKTIPGHLWAYRDYFFCSFQVVLSMALDNFLLQMLTSAQLKDLGRLSEDLWNLLSPSLVFSYSLQNTVLCYVNSNYLAFLDSELNLFDLGGLPISDILFSNIYCYIFQYILSHILFSNFCGYFRWKGKSGHCSHSWLREKVM